MNNESKYWLVLWRCACISMYVYFASLSFLQTSSYIVTLSLCVWVGEWGGLGCGRRSAEPSDDCLTHHNPRMTGVHSRVGPASVSHDWSLDGNKVNGTHAQGAGLKPIRGRRETVSHILWQCWFNHHLLNVWGFLCGQTRYQNISYPQYCGRDSRSRY